MNEKQNALEIIRFGAPQRVQTAIPCHMTEYHGVNHQGYADAGMPDGHDRPVGSVWTDVWGTSWHKEYPGVMGFPKGNPLALTDALAGYRFPDPNDERICSCIYESAKRIPDRDRMFLTGSHRDTLWEKSYMLVGMETMMEYFYNEPDYAKSVLHSIMDFQLGIAQHYINVGVEMVCLGDDLGTQSSLILSPETIREFLVPEYRRLFSFYKSRGVLIQFHSCGHIVPLLSIFMELGVDVLNPIQATANNLEDVISLTQGKMALLGGIATKLLIEGSADDIKSTVKSTIKLLGEKGGYFCCPDQYMPIERVALDILEQAVADYGVYPLVK